MLLITYMHIKVEYKYLHVAGTPMDYCGACSFDNYLPTIPVYPFGHGHSCMIYFSIALNNTLGLPLSEPCGGCLTASCTPGPLPCQP